MEKGERGLTGQTKHRTQHRQTSRLGCQNKNKGAKPRVSRQTKIPLTQGSESAAGRGGKSRRAWSTRAPLRARNTSAARGLCPSLHPQDQHRHPDSPHRDVTEQDLTSQIPRAWCTMPKLRLQHPAGMSPPPLLRQARVSASTPADNSSQPGTSSNPKPLSPSSPAELQPRQPHQYSPHSPSAQAESFNRYGDRKAVGTVPDS